MKKFAVIITALLNVANLSARDDQATSPSVEPITISLGEFSPVPAPPKVAPIQISNGTTQTSNSSAEYPLLVSQVINGDTIVIQDFPVKVKLAGIDAQEPVYNQCYGAEAKHYVASRIENRYVRLEESPDSDANGRYLAFVWYNKDGTQICLNKQMVEEGIVRVNPGSQFKERNRYLVLQGDARYDEKGFWKKCIQWIPHNDLGSYSIDPGGKVYKTKRGSNIFIREAGIANGSYIHTFKIGDKNLPSSIYGYKPYKLFADETLISKSGYIIRTKEGEFGPMFELDEVRDLMARHPKLSVQDFILPNARSSAWARVYPGTGTKIGVW